MQHVSAAARPTARACADRIEQYLDGDRDLARRRALADELVGFARPRTRATSAAMRCARRARPSRSIPRRGRRRARHHADARAAAGAATALEAALAEADRADITRHARAAIPGYLLIAAFIPLVLFTHVLSWTAIIGAASAALLMAVAAFRLMRRPERSFRWMASTPSATRS